jgi:hypothetical protein
MSILSLSRLTLGDRCQYRRGLQRRAKRPARFRPSCDLLECRALLSNFVVTNTNDSGAGSLRQAILDAPNGATISFANSLKSQTITLTSGVLTLDRTDVTGNQAFSQGASGSGIENVTGATLTTNRSVISNNQVTTTADLFVVGGEIDNQVGATVTIRNSTISGIAAVGGPGVFDGGWGEGGAISNAGTLSISSSTLSDNQAEGGNNAGVAGLAVGVANQAIGGTGYGGGGGLATGGAIETFGTLPAGIVALLITQTAISKNVALAGGDSSAPSAAAAIGGGIYNTAVGLAVSGSMLSGNEATGAASSSPFRGGSADGGGIYNGGGVVTISASAITGNSATGGAGISSPMAQGGVGGNAVGGGVCTIAGDVTLDHTPVAGNTAAGGGGGNSSGGNSCGAGGESLGGGYYSSGTLVYSYVNGQFVETPPASTVTATDSSFIGNTARGGAGGQGSGSAPAAPVEKARAALLTTTSIRH